MPERRLGSLVPETTGTRTRVIQWGTLDAPKAGFTFDSTLVTFDSTKDTFDSTGQG